MISRCFAHLIHWLFRMFGWIFNRPAPPDCSSRSDLSGKQVSGHIYELYKPIDGSVQLEILFFHGLQLGDTSKEYMTTWTNEKNELWPALWLPVKFPQARILSVSYDANIKKSIKQGRLDMYNLTENLTYDIGAAGIGQTPGCPVILVGHCFGGLVIKTVCVEAHKVRGHKYHHEKQKMTNFLENLEGIFFYSTPHPGAPFADLASRLLDGPLLEYVTWLNENATRLDGELCSACGNLFLEKKILSVGEKNKTKILKGFDVLMVPEDMENIVILLMQITLPSANRYKKIHLVSKFCCNSSTVSILRIKRSLWTLNLYFLGRSSLLECKHRWTKIGCDTIYTGEADSSMIGI